VTGWFLLVKFFLISFTRKNKLATVAHEEQDQLDNQRIDFVRG